MRNKISKLIFMISSLMYLSKENKNKIDPPVNIQMLKQLKISKKWINNLKKTIALKNNQIEFEDNEKIIYFPLSAKKMKKLTIATEVTNTTEKP